MLLLQNLQEGSWLLVNVRETDPWTILKDILGSPNTQIQSHHPSYSLFDLLSSSPVLTNALLWLARTTALIVSRAVETLWHPLYPKLDLAMTQKDRHETRTGFDLSQP